MRRRWRTYFFCVLIFALFVAGVTETVWQTRENRYVSSMAQSIVSQAHASDTISEILSLRDYLRQNVGRQKYPAAGRPKLRATAAEILSSGNGRCGESTRAFINMAGSLGIHAQRLYLEGNRSHVVALVRFDDGRLVIVDSSDKPYFQDLEDFQNLSQYPQFNYYSALNLRRILRSLALPANTLDLRWLNYFIERPHALKALLCFSFAGFSLSLFALRAARRRFRMGLTGNRRLTQAQAASRSSALATADQ